MVAAVELSTAQRDLFERIELTLEHFFVTGRAGTGKSTLLAYLAEHTSKQLAICAPTGVAALNVGGQTIHSLFRLPIGIIADHQLPLPGDVRDLLRRLELLVVDEVSMVSADLMDAIDRALREARRSRLPFGGVQLVLFGDPYQLAPVPPREPAERQYFADHYRSLWFFDAKVWQQAPLTTVELTTIHRQRDDEFKRLLNAVRHGAVTAEMAEVLNSAGARPVPDPRPITLAARNDEVQRINDAALAALPGAPKTAVAEITGDFGRTYPADESLRLKPGARVMFLRNDADQRWVNGSMGHVHSVDRSGVVVDLDDGDRVDVVPVTWEKYRYTYSAETRTLSRDVVGEFTQFPLRLAWAVTIHKSQGQTYPSAVVDLGAGAFSPGQTYVALSRIVSLEGLYLTRPLRPRDVITDVHVERFMREALGVHPPVAEDA